MENELNVLVSSALQSDLMIGIIVLILLFLFKDYTVNIASGLAFKLNKDFNEGDLVLIDDKEAIIVNIGLRQTKFQFKHKNKITWKYVYNSRIPWMNISKVIYKENKGSKNEE